MAEILTAQQKMAVENRGGPLLVSAAAGSGKTKVLVDRLLLYLNDPIKPANIDDFLIITYTKAAAGELRGKIAKKLTEQIALHPENRHLQQQMQRLYLAKISTVHGFCTDILREYAYLLNISADFRVADENECLELQTRVLEKILEDAYENSDPDFCALVDSQGFGRDDRQIPEIVLKVYNSARCHLDPEQWLQKCLDCGNTEAITDAIQTTWGEYLVKDLQQYLAWQMQALESCILQMDEAGGLEKQSLLLKDTVVQLKALTECSSWDEIIRHKKIDFGRLTFPRNIEDPELVGRVKAVRENCKKGLEKKLRSFSDDSLQILSDLNQAMQATRGLVEMVKAFDRQYAALKRSKRVLDFGDLEHLTLDLFLGKGRSGATRIAKEIGRRFREVMVDEYQDSNGVQDAIFQSLTGEQNNCFMVGDVKQSIYQFRLADPGIFLEKYNEFAYAEDAAPGAGRKIMLSSNFRSAASVIAATNDVFETCMSAQTGGLDYGEDEKLYEGINHAPMNESEIEMYAVDVQEDTYEEEAEFVTQRISQLLDGTHMVRDKDGLRPITAGDIVILLRSPGSSGTYFQRSLEKKGIPCETGGNTDILRTEEVQVLRSILQIINNPLQDIPMSAVLLSRVFRFTADDLAKIRSEHRYRSLYDALRTSKDEKTMAFLQCFSTLREEARLCTVPVLINRIFALTRLDSIYAAMDDGKQRIDNIQTFCQLAAAYAGGSLNQFLYHLDAMDERGLLNTSEGGTMDAVTIMSIHKSKGLEFPVVFLCGLSRKFNLESARSQVLCDKNLGLGLCCVDTKNRVRYPTVAKRAIAAKIISEAISEEMRVLYVAMTRAKDRLIMTYASNHLQSDLTSVVERMDVTPKHLMTSDVDCPGDWILLTALRRQEAGSLFALAGRPVSTQLKPPLWHIETVTVDKDDANYAAAEENAPVLDPEQVRRIEASLGFVYAHSGATVTPSKQTATQIKGREKDQEVAEGANNTPTFQWRKPTFAAQEKQGTVRGKAMHTVLQYIDYDQCQNAEQIQHQISQMVERKLLPGDWADMVDVSLLLQLFQTPMGQRLAHHDHVIREFKFSILDDASRYNQDVTQERVLLQGVVDCAILDDDGIVILDFKTDRIGPEKLAERVDFYKPQVKAYATALTRIYQIPVKSVQLYFFALNQFVEVMM